MSISSTIAVFHYLKGPKKQYETALQIIWTPMTTLSLRQTWNPQDNCYLYFFYLHHVLLGMYFSVSWVWWVSSFRFGVSGTFCVQRAYSWNFRWGNHCRKGLEICISNKPVKSPLQIAEGVFESFGPILLLVEALSDGVVFHFVILNPARPVLDYYRNVEHITRQEYLFFLNNMYNELIFSFIQLPSSPNHDKIWQFYI